MIVNKTDRQVSVIPFIKSLDSIQKVPIITAAIAYDDPRFGKVYILVIHQAVERPKFLINHPTDLYRVIVLEDECERIELTYP
jgi:hypothetical protein